MDRPNVVWLTLDSVRYDATTMGGADRETTPRLDALARGADGASFDAAFAHSNWTLASSSSILTGMLPTHHTVGITGDALPETVPTVAERFRDAGYRTACVSRNTHLSAATGFDRGFDRFSALLASTFLREAGPVLTAKWLANIRRHSAGFTTEAAKHATPYLVNGVATRWLEDLRGSEPFFLYCHYNEPHRPYVPPRAWLDQFAGELPMSPSEAADIAFDIHENLYEIVADGCELTDREWTALRVMYDTEIAYTDEMVGRLVDRVQSATDDTVVVVTADHGELFGEHGLLSHKFVLDDAVTRVPLVTHGLPAGDLAADTDEVVGHADVMRTLLELARADTDGLYGVDLRETTPDGTVAQRGPEEFEGMLRHDGSFDTTRFHAATLSSLRTDEWRYQRSDDRVELFELPDETTDRSDEYPERASDLDARLDETLETHGRPAGGGANAEFSEEMRRQLSDLGYVD